MSLPSDIVADFRFLNRQRKGIRALLAALASRGFKALVIHRLAKWCQSRHLGLVSALLTKVNQHWYCIDISPKALLGPGIVIVHGFGIVVGSQVDIAGQCVLFHGVTLGDRGSEWVGALRTDGHPMLGRGCIVGAGAKILGKLVIGDNCVFGANCVVVHDIAANSVVAGVPGRVVNERPAMDANLRPIEGNYRKELRAEAGGDHIETTRSRQP